MFERFRKKEEGTTPDVKNIRDRLLRFIKEQLQQWEGGEGKNIRNIHLYITCTPEEKSMYKAAVYASEEGRFQNEEVQRIADDYAIELPADYNFETVFATELPPGATPAKDLAAALLVTTGGRIPALKQFAKAYLRVLNGEAEQERYAFDSDTGRINMGRERKVQAADGFYRENTVAFPATSQHESNKFISRQHAHIEWSAEAGQFLLFADEGGIPPRNKVKVRPRGGGEAIKLQSAQVGHALHHGDQIILGDSALLEFGIEV